VEKLRNRNSRSITKGRDTLSYSAHSVADVFESGSYTIVLATSVDQIPEALEMVPQIKRSSISAELLSSLGELYDGWPIAVCCFDGDKVSPEPMIWQFEPKFKHILLAPALDAHTGGAPNLNKRVSRSHKLAFYSYRMETDNCLNADFRYSEIPQAFDFLFGKKVKGAVIDGKGQNGDFAIKIDDLITGHENIKKHINITVGV